ncbi:MHYT domain-containing protein [Solemya pervernicosa gill symbiont]|nr:MHYT domain-containing protein [Solemya pervernicosa gill symbiont]
MNVEPAADPLHAMNYYYDYWLVTLSVVLAILAGFTALSLAAKVPHVQGRKGWYWLMGGAVAMGVGIWSMHFVGMLAFHLSIPLAYDIPITFASIVMAIVASLFALALIRNGIHRLRTLIASGLLMGSGIAAMHYTGMAALKMSPPIQYEPMMVALSFLIAFAASLYALKLAFHNSDDGPVMMFSAKKLLSSVVMGVAISGMHYVAMGAAYFDPNAICLADPTGLDSATLAVVTASVTLLLMLGTLLLLSYDIQIARQNAIADRHG